MRDARRRLGQSGGPTSVINASLAGVIKEAGKHECIEEIYGGANGIFGMLNEERTQAIVGAYRGAKASIADVLMARRGEIDVRTQTLQLEWDTARLWAQLNFLTPDDGTSRTNRTLSRSRQ